MSRSSSPVQQTVRSYTKGGRNHALLNLPRTAPELKAADVGRDGLQRSCAVLIIHWSVDLSHLLCRLIDVGVGVSNMKPIRNRKQVKDKSDEE
jgi:hypothetical protein